MLVRERKDLCRWGDPECYSEGARVIMADRQIQREARRGAVQLCSRPDSQDICVLCKESGKWFLISGWSDDTAPTEMLGAACGDIAGSVYEWNNIKYKPDPDSLAGPDTRCTDDTVMTCAVADGLRRGLGRLPPDWMASPEAEDVLCGAVQEALLKFGRAYPNAGYGGSFRRWLSSDCPQPYNSWGNGSAMRASYAGWAARSLEEAEKLGEISAKVTHNHPEGIKGAVVVAGSIFLLRQGASKEDIRDYAGKAYDLNFKLDDIRESYTFDVSCMGSVPQAVAAFLEGGCFTDVLASAISIGGDSDTIAAIAGSLAEAVYPIPQALRGRVIDRMDGCLLDAIARAVDFARRRTAE